MRRKTDVSNDAEARAALLLVSSSCAEGGVSRLLLVRFHRHGGVVGHLETDCHKKWRLAGMHWFGVGGVLNQDRCPLLFLFFVFGA